MPINNGLFIRTFLLRKIILLLRKGGGGEGERERGGRGGVRGRERGREREGVKGRETD